MKVIPAACDVNLRKLLRKVLLALLELFAFVFAAALPPLSRPEHRKTAFFRTDIVMWTRDFEFY